MDFDNSGLISYMSWGKQKEFCYRRVTKVKGCGQIHRRGNLEIEIKRLGFIQMSKETDRRRTNRTWDFNGRGGESNRRWRQATVKSGSCLDHEESKRGSVRRKEEKQGSERACDSGEATSRKQTKLEEDEAASSSVLQFSFSQREREMEKRRSRGVTQEPRWRMWGFVSLGPAGGLREEP